MGTRAGSQREPPSWRCRAPECPVGFRSASTMLEWASAPPVASTPAAAHVRLASPKPTRSFQPRAETRARRASGAHLTLLADIDNAHAGVSTQHLVQVGLRYFGNPPLSRLPTTAWSTRIRPSVAAAPAAQCPLRREEWGRRVAPPRRCRSRARRPPGAPAPPRAAWLSGAPASSWTPLQVSCDCP